MNTLKCIWRTYVTLAVVNRLARDVEAVRRDFTKFYKQYRQEQARQFNERVIFVPTYKDRRV